MSSEQARALVAKASRDDEFRARLESAPLEERRAILVEHGFGDVKLRHLSEVLPASAGGELSDEEFAAVAGGGDTASAVVIGVGSLSNAAAILCCVAAASA